MHKAKKRGVKRANPVLYAVACFILWVFVFVRFGFTRPRGTRLEAPFIALCNHASNFDFAFALLSLYPKRVNPLTAAYFFNHKFLAVLLRLLGAIPREQFRPDAASIRKTLELLREGGNILIFPEGEVSGTGRTDIFPENIARLIGRSGVNVYAIHLYGSHLARPKWAKYPRRGRVKAELSPLLSAEEAKTLSVDEILERVHTAISHDEYVWQETARVPFYAKNPAERLEMLLYKCPRCGAEPALVTSGRTLSCERCGNAAVLDDYGFLSPVDESCVIYRHISDFVEYQRASIREEIKAGPFVLEAEAELQLHLSDRTLNHESVGEGIVRLQGEALTYAGTRYGESISLRFPLDSLFKLPFSAGENFEVPNATELIAFKPKEKRLIAKFVLALPVLRELM